MQGLRFNRAALLPYALLVALALVGCAPVLFTGRVLLPGAMLSGFLPFGGATQAPWTILQWDSLAQYFPWRTFAAREIAAGHIPLWNPYQFTGAPFVANAQSAVFYPLNFPFWVMDTGYAFGVTAFLHVLLAMVGTYRLAHSWGVSRASAILGAVAFAFCGYMAAWSLLPTLASTAAWLPLCLWLLQVASDGTMGRKSRLAWPLLVVAMSCALLAGHAQIFFYVVMALWLRVPFLQRWMRGACLLFGACFMTVLLAAVQILPTLELARLGHRAGGGPTMADWQVWQLRALLPQDLLGVFIPGIPTGQGSLNENFPYIGTGLLLLGIIGAVRLVIDQTRGKVPAQEPAQNQSAQSEKPGEETVPVPTASGTAAAPELQANEPAPAPTAGEVSKPLVATSSAWVAVPIAQRKAVWFALLLAVFGLVYAMATPLALLVYFCVPGVSMMGGTGRALLLWSAGMALLTAVGADWVRGIQRGLVVPGVLLLWVGGELLGNAFITVPTAPRASIYPPTALTDFLAKNTSPTARALCYTPRSQWLPAELLMESGRNHPLGILPPNGAMVYGIYDVNGYDSLAPRAYRSWVAGEERDNEVSPKLNGNIVLLNNFESAALLDSLSVRYVVTPATLPLQKSPGKLVLAADGCLVWERAFTNAATPVNGTAFYPGWRDGVFQPETFRLGLYLSLFALAALAGRVAFIVAPRRARS